MQKTDPIIEQKQALRREMRCESRSRSLEERLSSSLALCRLVEQHPAFVAATHVLLYHPLPTEVSTLPLLDKYIGHKQLYLPLVCGDELTVVPYRGKEFLRRGAFGVMEPTGSPVETLDCIQCTVVPGVAFDRFGNRLGYGKGYYDRLLPRLIHSYTIGICFASHLLPSVPCEQSDRRVDCVLTD